MMISLIGTQDYHLNKDKVTWGNKVINETVEFAQDLDPKLKAMLKTIHSSQEIEAGALDTQFAAVPKSDATDGKDVKDNKSTPSPPNTIPKYAFPFPSSRWRI